MAKRLFGKTFAKWYRNLFRNTKYRWVVLLGTLLYLVSPIDISPDVVPFIGWIDDGLIATIAIAEISQLLTERKQNQRSQAQADFASSAKTATEGTVIDVEAMPVQ